jgi:ferredoxin
MDHKRVKMAFYSPTLTTQRVLAAIAKGLQAETLIELDLTPPDAETRRLPEADEDLLLLGAPVYAGRIPTTAATRFRRLRGIGTPAVVVVVYGNRAYEDALLELYDLVATSGFVPVAAGAFIGEHSYATETTPIALGRPDDRDRVQAIAFGQAVGAMLSRMPAYERVPPLDIPGDRPFRTGMQPSDAAPTTQVERCTLCGACAAVCPVGAIRLNAGVHTDGWACTLCCACVKTCRTGARVMLDEGVLGTAEWLATEHGMRKEPELFLP